MDVWENSILRKIAFVPPLPSDGPGEWFRRWTGEARRLFHEQENVSLTTEVIRRAFRLGSSAIAGLRSLADPDADLTNAVIWAQMEDGLKRRRVVHCVSGLLGSTLLQKGSWWRKLRQAVGTCADAGNSTKWRRVQRGRPREDWERVFVHVWGDAWQNALHKEPSTSAETKYVAAAYAISGKSAPESPHCKKNQDGSSSLAPEPPSKRARLVPPEVCLPWSCDSKIRGEVGRR